MIFNRTLLLFSILLCSSMLSACNQEQSSGDAQVAPVPEMPVLAEASPAASEEAATILYAQVGSELDAAGVLVQSKELFSLNEPIFAFAGFKGNSGQTGVVSVLVTNSSGNSVFNGKSDYLIEGDGGTVMIPVRNEGAAPFEKGLYKVLFSCNGAPCWELSFTVK